VVSAAFFLDEVRFRPEVGFAEASVEACVAFFPEVEAFGASDACEAERPVDFRRLSPDAAPVEPVAPPVPLPLERPVFPEDAVFFDVTRFGAAPVFFRRPEFPPLFLVVADRALDVPVDDVDADERADLVPDDVSLDAFRLVFRVEDDVDPDLFDAFFFDAVFLPDAGPAGAEVDRSAADVWELPPCPGEVDLRFESDRFFAVFEAFFLDSSDFLVVFRLATFCPPAHVRIHVTLLLTKRKALLRVLQV